MKLFRFAVNTMDSRNYLQGIEFRRISSNRVRIIKFYDRHNTVMRAELILKMVEISM